MSNYEFVVRGYLDKRWEDSFAGMRITHLLDGDTKLQGELIDQASVYGAISRLRDLNLELISVQLSDGEKKDGATGSHS